MSVHNNMAFATEIADSDDEGEGDFYPAVAPSPQQLPKLPSSCLKTGSPSSIFQIDLPIGVNFSDFLSQSHGPDTQNSNPTHSEARMSSSKRSHSEMIRPGRKDGSPPGKRSRQKTYASNRCLRSSQSELFLEEQSQQGGGGPDATEGSHTLESDIQSEAVSQQQDSYADNTESMAAEGAADGLEDLLLPQYEVEGVSSLEIGSTNNTARYNAYTTSDHTTTRSLVGTYEPINLDFGQNGIGSDMIANPFGTPDPAPGNETSRNHGPGPIELSNGYAKYIDGQFFSPDHQKESATAELDRALAGRSFSPSIENDDTAATRQTSARSKSFVDPAQLMRDSPEGVASSTSTSTNPRKRRKTEDLVSSTVMTDRPEHGVGLGLERATQPKKRGRKPKSQLVDAESPAPDESQHVASIKNPQPDPLPAKSSSSDLHLDDEAVIGLPKEVYNPRPSRSRSKRTHDNSMPPPSQTPAKRAPSPDKPPATPSADESTEIIETDSTPLNKTKKAKGRKNKLKRAKTSAAALLGKSNKMLSDGEEDVVWVDERPATVKMTVPDPFKVKDEQKVDLDATKEEQTDFEDDDTAQKPEETRHETSERNNHVVVVVPLKNHVPDPLPKRRGRKRKETTDQLAVDEESAATPEPSAEPSSPMRKSKQKRPTSRQPLQEKDTNINTEPKEGAESKTSAEFTAAAENHPATPEKGQDHTSGAGTGGRLRNETLKGPTAHSPINPSGGKVRYRVGLSRRAAIPSLLKIVRK